jgi:MarR family transcriptional regulator, 2-MHQ and catechol-resistance regulon repressor
MAKSKEDGSSEDFGAGLSALRFVEKYPWVDSDALQTHIALTRAFISLNDAMTKFLQPQGLELSRAQYNFLAVLSVAEDNSLSLREIARETGISAPYVTKLVDALEKEGLVERVPSPLDRRVTHAHLTDEGRLRCETIVPGFLRFVAQIGQSLTPDERAQLRSLVAKYASVDPDRLSLDE